MFGLYGDSGGTTTAKELSASKSARRNVTGERGVFGGVLENDGSSVNVSSSSPELWGWLPSSASGRGGVELVRPDEEVGGRTSKDREGGSRKDTACRTALLEERPG